MRSRAHLSSAFLASFAPIVLGLLAGGCGWHAGLVAPEGGKSVGVEVFQLQHDILARGIEPLLQEELERAVVNLVRAPLAVPGKADLVVRGQITDIRRRQGIRSSGNLLSETGLYLAARADLVDRRSGEVIVAGQERHIWSGYATGPEAIANEDAARRRALRNLSATLILDLFRTSTSSNPADTADSSVK